MAQTPSEASEAREDARVYRLVVFPSGTEHAVDMATNRTLCGLKCPLKTGREKRRCMRCQIIAGMMKSAFHATNPPTERSATPLDLAAPSEDDVRLWRERAEKYRDDFSPGEHWPWGTVDGEPWVGVPRALVIAIIADRDRLAAENARLQEERVLFVPVALTCEFEAFRADFHQCKTHATRAVVPRGSPLPRCAVGEQEIELAKAAALLEAAQANVARLQEENARLAAVVGAVRKLHQPFAIYDDCGHEDDEHTGPTANVDSIGETCAHMYDICPECCCAGDDQQIAECIDGHDHGPGKPICATRAAIDAALATDAPQEHADA